jgi:hypothetical protein
MKRLGAISIFLTLVLLVSAVFVLMSMALLHPGGSADPFTAYEAYMPGQPFPSSIEQGCRLQESSEDQSDPTYCQMWVEEGPFRQVTVGVRDGIVHSIWFRAQGLAMADIVYHWGFPERIAHNGRFFYLSWEQGLYAIVSSLNHIDKFSFRLSIEQLTLTIQPPTVSGQ